MNDFSSEPGAARAFPAAFLSDRLPRVPGLALRGNGVLARRQRGYELGLPRFAEARGRLMPLVVAVGGGKGGVGKSLVAANLAVRFAHAGLKTLAVDLDVGGANLHTYFAVGQPTAIWPEAVVLQTKPLRDVIQVTGVPNARFLAGGREEVWGGAAALDSVALTRLWNGFADLAESGEVDVVILDLGAGSGRQTVEFFTSAHLSLLTALPEPTSIENAYAFLKAVLLTLIDQVGERTHSEHLVPEIKALLCGSGARGYAERLAAAATLYPGFVAQIRAAFAGRVTGIVVNQIRCQKDIDVGKSMELIGERYFGLDCRFLGHLNYDEAAWKALRNRRMLALDFPHSALALRLAEVARQALSSLGLPEVHGADRIR